jgi:hypothetical protein
VRDSRRREQRDGHPEPSARSAEQVAEERAMAEVSDVLLNLVHTLTRARKARKRLQQDVYFAGDELRLI